MWWSHKHRSKNQSIKKYFTCSQIKAFFTEVPTMDSSGIMSLRCWFRNSIFPWITAYETCTSHQPTQIFCILWVLSTPKVSSIHNHVHSIELTIVEGCTWNSRMSPRCMGSSSTKWTPTSYLHSKRSSARRECRGARINTKGSYIWVRMLVVHGECCWSGWRMPRGTNWCITLKFPISA